jgi:hypothetical protein
MGAAMSPVDWNFLFRERFDHTRTLNGDEVRFFVERADAPSQEIRRQLAEVPGRATKFFLSGGPGSGKSSELAHLAHLLDDDYAVIGLDVHQSAANVTKVSPAEVLFMMGAAACRLSKERWGQPISDHAQKQLMDAFLRVAQEPAKLKFERLIEGTSVIVGAGAAAAGQPAAGGIVATVGKGLADLVSAGIRSTAAPRPFGGLTRDVREGDPEVEALADALAGVLAEVNALRPPVVLVDGLDRIEELGSIKQLFFHTTVLDLPPCPVVYNGPIALQLNTEAMQLSGSARFESVPLPTIPVEGPVGGHARVADTEIAAGRELLRQVVARRLQSDDLDPTDIFEPEAIEAMIGWSGGVIRDLIRLAHWSLRLGARREPQPARVDISLAREAFDKSAKEVQLFAANQLRRDELVSVEDHGELSGSEESLRLLLRGAILTYQDHVPWYRVHPFLRPLLGGEPR